jgi:hypothetical protein
MTDDEDNDGDATPENWPNALYAIRRRGTGPSLASSVVALARAVPAILGTGPFDWNVSSDPPRRVELSPAVIERLMEDSLILADRPANWTTVIGADAPFTPPGMRALDILDVGLPGPRQRQLTDLAGMMALVEAAATALQGHVAYTQDAALAHMYCGRRAMERSHAAIARAVPGYVSDEKFEPIAGVAPGLPELHEAIELDDTLAPEAVYWVNWWNANMIDAMGRERVENAGWARIKHHADGAMTLAATEDPPDLTSARDVKRLSEIIAALDLIQHQERNVVRT